MKLRPAPGVFCFAVQLALAAAFVQTSPCRAHEEPHGHHAGESHAGVQTGQFMMFSAGPNMVSGPNYLLGSGPLIVSQPIYPPLMVNANTSGWIGQGALLPPASNFPGLGAPAGNGGFGPPPAPAHVRPASNDASRARANQFVRFGDDHFHKQKYNDALERYKDASRSAPDLPEPYFRQAFAWAAMKKYDQAARAIRHGLALEPNWAASDFQLSQVYGDNRLAKVAHWEALAQAATDEPENADLLFLLAVELYFDGQQARSAAFFQRAKALEPGDPSHIRAFLERLDAAAGKPQPAAGKQL